jgi:glutathione S-transferase
MAESELEARPKGAAEKQLLAWWLCQHTTVRRRWVSERLRMGDESRVTQAIRRVKRGLEPAMQHLKEQLDKAFESGRPTDT